MKKLFSLLTIIALISLTSCGVKEEAAETDSMMQVEDTAPMMDETMEEETPMMDETMMEDNLPVEDDSAMMDETMMEDSTMEDDTMMDETMMEDNLPVEETTEVDTTMDSSM